jgi:hypothetical protein
MTMARRQSQHPGVRRFLFGFEPDPNDDPAIPPEPPTARDEHRRVTRPSATTSVISYISAGQPSATEWTPLST